MIPEHLQIFLDRKREEYEYAIKHNKPMLAEITRQAVKNTCKKFGIKLVPGEQQKLF